MKEKEEEWKEVHMGRTFTPQKYKMVFCPVCNGKGKLPKNPHSFEVCKECGGFVFVKREPKEIRIPR